MKFGLIGKNLSHSYSKHIHELMFLKNYQLLSINHVNEVFNHDLDGFNITNPFKTDILNHLDELDNFAKETNVVNTVIKRNHQLYGYNTDLDGFDYLVQFHHINFENKNVIIIGNGSTSNTIAHYLKNKKIKSLIKLVRTIRNDNEDKLAHQSQYSNTNIIINTTPVGMFPNNEDKLLINFHNFKKCELVIDLIYNPYRTQLLIEAEKFNIKTVNGLYMLIGQAKKTQELLLNKTIPNTIMDKIYHQAIDQYVNIVFIGLPLSGKTSYGKILSQETSKEWIDSDILIESYSKLSIKEIFKLYGEEKFRSLEKELFHLIYKKQGIIISCGGGVVLNSINIDLLKQNGMIIYINRDVSEIDINDDSRPLLNQKSDLIKLVKERSNLYQKHSDIELKINQKMPFSIERMNNKIHEYLNR